MAGSLWLFLLRNVFGAKSKMFISDFVTILMGLFVVWYVINLLNSHNAHEPLLSRPNQNLAAVALGIENVPVFDTLRVMGMRIMRGRSPFSPDRTHLHHKFIGLGVSYSVTAISMIGINLLIALIGWSCCHYGAGMGAQLHIIIAAGIILVWACIGFTAISPPLDTLL